MRSDDDHTSQSACLLQAYSATSRLGTTWKLGVSDVPLRLTKTYSRFSVAASWTFSSNSQTFFQPWLALT